MKTGKFFILGILGLLLVLFACSEEASNSDSADDPLLQTRSGIDLIDLLGTSCVPENIVIPGVCNDTTFVDTLVVTNLPDYPNCSFTVIFETSFCIAFGLQDLNVGDFQILEHDCQEFSDDIEDIINQSPQSDFVIDFELAMWDAIEVSLIEREFEDETKFNCGQGVHWNINWIRASCYTYAGYGQSELFPRGRYGRLYTYAKIGCGSQCCERHTRVCRNDDGTLNIETYDVTNPFTIDCSDESFLVDIPYYFHLIGEPCRVSCPD